MRLSIPLLTSCLVFLAACATLPEQIVLQRRDTPVVVTPPSRSIPGRLSRDVVDELNLVRTNPRRYADLLADRLDTYSGPEGKKALREAIAVLRATRPVQPLKPVAPLEAAAADHVQDQGKTGKRGHTGSDGSQPFDRIRRYLNTNGAGENIAYGIWDAREMIMALVIDDGIPNRGHRRNILDPDYALVGVATGDHPGYKIVCVMDFALPARN